jgi:hypothetical protein
MSFFEYLYAIEGNVVSFFMQPAGGVLIFGYNQSDLISAIYQDAAYL